MAFGGLLLKLLLLLSCCHIVIGMVNQNGQSKCGWPSIILIVLQLIAAGWWHRNTCFMASPFWGVARECGDEQGSIMGKFGEVYLMILRWNCGYCLISSFLWFEAIFGSICHKQCVVIGENYFNEKLDYFQYKNRTLRN